MVMRRNTRSATEAPPRIKGIFSPANKTGQVNELAPVQWISVFDSGVSHGVALEARNTA